MICNSNSGGRKLGAAMLALLAFMLQTSICWATLQSEMQGMFNTMTNVTDGGYYQGLGRGVVAGPSVVMRGNRVRTDLFNFMPPSIDAGCGGIDMFMGSFSFIDADHFINLMQSIATSAAGYAFKLALQTMCPTCAHAVSELQQAMQKLNGMAGDSCKIAQTGVNYMADKLDVGALATQMKDGPIASAATMVGNAADSFTSFLNQANSGSPTNALGDSDIIALLGNPIWKVLQKNNFVGSAFISGDNDLAEALMSVTGTVVGTKQGDSDTPVIRDWPPTLSVKDLLDGSSSGGGDPPRKYHCEDNDNCVQIYVMDYNFQGLEKYISAVLLGADGNADGTDSFIYKLLNNTGALTPQEKQLIRVSPYHMTRLRNMAVCAGQNGMGSTPTYAKKAARLMALEVIARYLKDAQSAIYQITQGNGTDMNGHNIADALIPKVQANLKKVNAAMAQEQAGLSATLTTDLEGIYQGAVKNCNLTPMHLNTYKMK